jgi:hypothetical protein
VDRQRIQVRIGRRLWGRRLRKCPVVVALIELVVVHSATASAAAVERRGVGWVGVDASRGVAIRYADLMVVIASCSGSPAP